VDAGAAGRQRLHCHHADQAGQHGDEVLQHDIIEQLPISEKQFDLKTSQNQCHGRKQLKASIVCNLEFFRMLFIHNVFLNSSLDFLENIVLLNT